MLSEFRDSNGGLGAFELSGRFASVGGICTALGQLPDIHFETVRTSLWSSSPSRFTFKGRAFEISTVFQDIRIVPVEAGAVFKETEELLRLVVDNLVPKWQTRARSRFSRG